jgi:two-component system, OmpR family, aerobic respiration control sensor histidine kinase ArcB
MEAITLQNLTEMLLTTYENSIGKEAPQSMSSGEVVKSIVDYYEDIIGCMPGNVYWFNENGLASGCNQNVLRMFGFRSISEFRGLDFYAMGKVGNWSQEATESFKQDTLEVLRTGRSRLNIEELPIPDGEGKLTYFLTSRVPLFDRSGKILGVVGISIDITERKQMEEALVKAKESAEAASRAKQDFLKNIRHDIRTPFTGILSMGKFLYEVETDVDKKDKLSCITDGAQKLLDYLTEIVDFIEVDSGDVPVLFESFNLHQLIEDCLGMFIPSASAKGIQLKKTYDLNLPSIVIGDKFRTQRILINLLGNAIKFTETGYIEAEAKLIRKNKRDLIVSLKVNDTGIGIPKEKYNVIFEQFNRLTSAYSGIYKGSGLGLRAVKQMMYELGGEINIESEIGRGTSFICTLPIKESLLEEAKSSDSNEEI